jgi:NADH-quinone oxidoreductase subunit E
MSKRLSKIDQIIDKHHADKSELIQILLEIQQENHWLTRSVLDRVSQKLEVPLSQIYHISTFYKAFSLTPRGRHSVSVCLCTACHVRGAPRLLDKVTVALKIRPGETSADRKFTLITVNCLGCCAMGPVLVVNGEYYSNPSPTEIKQAIAACK